jgi:glycosyltransferase involved in cell wall biosynthesis
MRIAYIIPQFPGQTHIFFWRERAALQRLGVEVDIFSTRLPEQNTVCHSWSDEAMRLAIYLTPMGLRGLGQALAGLAVVGPIRGFRAIWMLWRMHQGCGLMKRLRSLGLLLPATRMLRLARRRGITHLHAHSCANSATLALLANVLGDMPYSLTLHGPLSDYGPGQRYKWKNASFAVVITLRLLRQAQNELEGSLPPNLQVAPMGVDVQKFSPQESRTEWCAGQTCRLFSCGRLTPGKGHHTLVEAVSLLRHQGVDIVLRVAGAESDRDGSYRRQLLSDSARLGIGDRTFLLGAISEDAVRAELQDATIFALASKAEPLGVAIMEAMAMGTPVIATASGGVSELIRHEQDGILVPPGDPAAVARAVLKLLDHPDLAKRLTVNARRRVTERFSSDVSARMIAERLGFVVKHEKHATEHAGAAGG